MHRVGQGLARAKPLDCRVVVEGPSFNSTGSKGVALNHYHRGDNVVDSVVAGCTGLFEQSLEVMTSLKDDPNV